MDIQSAKELADVTNQSKIVGILVTSEGSKTVIPFDPANTDYQAFLAWCAEGNTPEPADQQGAE